MWAAARRTLELPPRAAPLLVAAGWMLLYVPLYAKAFDTSWQTEDQGHAPIVLMVFVWLLWQLRKSLSDLPDRSCHWLGWPLFVSALGMLLLGRAYEFPILGFGSQIPMLAGILLLLKGLPGLRTAWFAVFFLLFMVPLPGVFVDASTQSLKQSISVLVTEVLHWLGYPISRTGVTISIGQYQLLVADACSGMHSMFSLTALGILFMYIVNRSNRLHNAIMLCLILPTAFVANALRVTILALVTYYFGEEAGRGFLHDFAGMALLVTSLLMLFTADSILGRYLPSRPGRRDALQAA